MTEAELIDYLSIMTTEEMKELIRFICHVTQ